MIINKQNWIDFHDLQHTKNDISTIKFTVKHTQTHTYAHPYIHVYMYMQTHTHTHRHTHKHTHILDCTCKMVDIGNMGDFAK